jgi:hypothetical protein
MSGFGRFAFADKKKKKESGMRSGVLHSRRPTKIPKIPEMALKLLDEAFAR